MSMPSPLRTRLSRMLILATSICTLVDCLRLPAGVSKSELAAVALSSLPLLYLLYALGAHDLRRWQRWGSDQWHNYHQWLGGYLVFYTLLLAGPHEASLTPFTRYLPVVYVVVQGLMVVLLWRRWMRQEREGYVPDHPVDVKPEDDSGCTVLLVGALKLVGLAMMLYIISFVIEEVIALPHDAGLYLVVGKLTMLGIFSQISWLLILPMNVSHPVPSRRILLLYAVYWALQAFTVTVLSMPHPRLPGPTERALHNVNVAGAPAWLCLVLLMAQTVWQKERRRWADQQAKL